MSVTVGLTGGIGSGKSTVARMLAERGAIVVDADRIAREVVAPGTDGLAAVDREFPGVVVDGVLDRAALAALVFTNPAALGRLEAITHPLIDARISELTAAAGAGNVVVVEVPLLVEKGREGVYDAVVAVGAGEDVRRKRLRETRGMTDDDVTARLANQASDAQRREMADYWIENEGSAADLERAVDEVWRRLARLPADGPTNG
ncbi:MAG TPA: dephospho-CoA kinase [Actinomycetaceae bacterium]|nr:dephospho-CoA kinase [Actinomycetaceae bacterium]